jgi:hypothetical protein
VEESLPSLSDINEHALTRQGTPDEDFLAFVLAHTPAVLMEAFQGKFDGLFSWEDMTPGQADGFLALMKSAFGKLSSVP